VAVLHRQRQLKERVHARGKGHILKRTDFYPLQLEISGRYQAGLDAAIGPDK
jgi:hypothetical protein